MENTAHLKHLKIGFIGAGNMATAFINSYLRQKIFRPEKIFVSNRSSNKAQKLKTQHGINVCQTNEELVESCDVVFIAIKPQDVVQAIEPIASTFHETNTVISFAAGITLQTLSDLIPTTNRIVRAMPNTPAEISKAVVGYAISEDASKDKGLETLIEDILQPLGYAVNVQEGEEFEALTVSCGSGTGFIFELMQYWQEWIEEHGFDSDTARKMTVQTFLGAAQLAENYENVEVAELQRRVTSKKGVTHAGLESMRELEVDRAMRYSFEKAVLRDRELGKK